LSDAVEMHRISRAIARRWLFILPVALVAAALGNLISREIDPVYEATTSVLAGQNVDPANVDDSDASKRLTLTLAALVRGRPVMDATVRELDLRLTSEQLSDRVSVNVIPDTQVMVLTVRASSPELAADIAEEVAEQFIAFSAGVTPLEQVVIEPARAGADPTAPDVAFNTLVAGALGFLLASAVALLFEFRPGRARRRASGLLGDVPELGRVRDGDRLIAFAPSDSFSAETEAYGEVFANLNVLLGAQSGRVVLVIGASVQHRRSIAAANLAAMFAMAGSRSILVDASLRRPSQHRLFWQRSSPGFSEYLADPAIRLSDMVRRTAVDGLHLLPAGKPTRNPAILFSPANLGRLAAELEHHGRMAVIDCPLDGNTAETVLLARHADLVIVVGRRGEDAGLDRRTIGELEQAGVEVSGVLTVKRRRLRRIADGLRPRKRAARQSSAWRPPTTDRASSPPAEPTVVSDGDAVEDSNRAQRRNGPATRTSRRERSRQRR
jgi:capsular polysaccharide biosynthesis protein/Mrp family chromosome partitioning ATPase